MVRFCPKPTKASCTSPFCGLAQARPTLKTSDTRLGANSRITVTSVQ